MNLSMTVKTDTEWAKLYKNALTKFHEIVYNYVLLLKKEIDNHISFSFGFADNFSHHSSWSSRVAHVHILTDETLNANKRRKRHFNIEVCIEWSIVPVFTQKENDFFLVCLKLHKTDDTMSVDLSKNNDEIIGAWKEVLDSKSSTDW